MLGHVEDIDETNGPAERRRRSGDEKNQQLSFFQPLSVPDISGPHYTWQYCFINERRKMQSCLLPGMIHMVSSRAESN